MKIKFFIFILGLLTATSICAQEKRFFMPREIQQAYEKGTRSYDGKPGPAYWQNTVDYSIQVSVDPADLSITGSENVTYYNNSPDELSRIVVRLYYDVYKKGNPRSASVNTGDITDGVELISITLNGEEVDQSASSFRRGSTNIYMQLTEPLQPGESLEFAAEWKQWIPKTNRRTGARDSTTFFVAYFYPQFSVYDDVFGWDEMTFNMRTEFYNNLGNYDVKITVPKSFTVWATGTLQNAAQVLSDAILARYEKAKTSTEIVNVLTPDDLEGYENAGETWHFSASEVSDFAFGMSDHYAWDAAMQNVDGREVLINSVYPAADVEKYSQLTSLQQKAMQHLSGDLPGIPYPYPVFTTFIGMRGGGMEFPMMANNAGPGRGVTIHEIFHTYFPMYVRINERRFAWMDEGWADYVTTQVTNNYFEENDVPVFANSKSSVQRTIGTLSDLPLITSSQFMDGSNYGYASYPLPEFVYSILQHYLGQDRFRSSLKTYINDWAKKSPTPYDFFYSFETSSGEDLAWLWKPWFFEFGYPDVEIKEYSKGKLTVENTGSRPVPLKIDVQYSDGTETSIVENARIWLSNGNTYTTKIKDPGDVQRIMVNLEIPDFDDLNNFYPPLTDIYASSNIDPGVLGVYKLNEFHATAYVTEKDKVFFLHIPRFMSTYLLPTEGNKFESLDGRVQLEFLKEDEKYTGMNISAFGFDITSVKQRP